MVVDKSNQNEKSVLYTNDIYHCHFYYSDFCSLSVGGAWSFAHVISLNPHGNLGAMYYGHFPGGKTEALESLWLAQLHRVGKW